MKLIIFILLLSSTLSAHAGVEIKPKKKRTVYLLSIGLTYKGVTNYSDYGAFTNCPVCINDAEGMAAYFQKLKNNKAPLTDSVVTYVYSSDINLDTLYKVFATLQQQVKENDIFIFYYASIGWGLQTDESGNSEGFYMLNQLADKQNKKERENNVYTLRHLKQLTDRIAAKKQLIIFDTGDGKVISADYYRNFFSDNIAEAEFSKKNRIIISPEHYSTEAKDPVTGKFKGDLFHVISNMPDSFNVLTIFDSSHHKPDYKSFWKHWYDRQNYIRSSISVIQEVDYLKVLSSINTQYGNGKRGLTIKQKESAPDENILNKKKKVLIVATSNYSAINTWARLKNPLNDGMDAEKIFSALGYEVTALYNKPKDTILSAISNLVDNEVQNPYSQYIIYFAGHGFYDARQKAGFIVCSDSKELKDQQKPTITELNSYIDYTVLFRNLDQLNKVILITDVCFGGTSVNSLLQSYREVDPKGEAAKMKNPFKKVLASGITTVDDFIRYHNGSISRNSPFAAALLDILKKEGQSLSFEELYGKLKNSKNLYPTPIESSFGNEKIPNAFSF